MSASLLCPSGCSQQDSSNCWSGFPRQASPNWQCSSENIVYSRASKPNKRQVRNFELRVQFLVRSTCHQTLKTLILQRRFGMLRVYAESESDFLLYRSYHLLSILSVTKVAFSIMTAATKCLNFWASLLSLQVLVQGLKQHSSTRPYGASLC